MRITQKVLLITYKYIPEIAPRVFRWSSIAEEWASIGIETDIICAAVQGTPPEEVINTANIYRIKPWFKNIKKTTITSSPSKTGIQLNENIPILDDRSTSSTEKIIKFEAKSNLSFSQKVQKYWGLFIHRNDPGFEEQFSVFDLLKELFRRLLRKVYYLFRRLLRKVHANQATASKIIRTYLWPDYGMMWIFPALQQARKLIRRNQYSTVITVSWPVSPHVVGWLIRKTIDERLKWIVDIGDPYSFNTTTPINDFNKFGKLNISFEKSLLSNASVISVTTEKTKEDYIEFLPSISNNIVVIPPLIPNNKKVNGQPKVNKEQKIQLIFTGSLRVKNRRPDALLHLFSELLADPELKNRLELHFYGDYNQCVASFKPYANLLDKQIFIHGIVKKETVDCIIHYADFLVNIGNKTENQLPSKTVEYVSTNRPIINISANINDTSWELFSQTGMAINVIAKTTRNITDEHIQQLTQFIKEPPKPMPIEELVKLTKPYSAETISNQYLSLINGTWNGN